MVEYWNLYDKNRVRTGKITADEKLMKKGDFRLISHVWIRNGKGEWLISKRAPNQPYAGWWEPTSGSVSAGEDTLTAALREAREEIGLTLNPDSGYLFKTVFRPYLLSPNFCDMWIFDCDIPIEKLKFQPEEVCDAMWATPGKIHEIMEMGIFMVHDMKEPIEELLEKETIRKKEIR